MDDLGEVNEVFADLYEFINVRTQVDLDSAATPPPNHQNLLAISSRYGKLYAAVGSKIKTCSLTDLRDPPEHASASTYPKSDASIQSIDLSSEDVASILQILLFLSESVLVVLAACASNQSQNIILFLHVTAIAEGKIHTLPALPVTGVVAIAVSPSPAVEDSSLFVCTTDSHIYVHHVSHQAVHPVADISVTGLLSIALSPRESLLAVGTSRGNVILYDPTEGERIGTVVEVESGWQPFQLHFAGESALFTSYQCAGTTNHVMWHLDYDGKKLSVGGKSPFGELCYPVIFGDEEGANIFPSVMFSYLDEWSLAVVTTSTSSDIEVVARIEDGTWANFKLGDKREAILPIVDTEETLPIGMDFDLNDTSTIPARDPDDPDINPMPTLVIMSNRSVLLSYRLVDDHRGAKCSAVRAPRSLPSLAPVRARTMRPPMSQLMNETKATNPVKKITKRSAPSETNSTPMGGSNLRNFQSMTPEQNIVFSATGKEFMKSDPIPSTSALFGIVPPHSSNILQHQGQASTSNTHSSSPSNFNFTDMVFGINSEPISTFPKNLKTVVAEKSDHTLPTESAPLVQPSSSAFSGSRFQSENRTLPTVNLQPKLDDALQAMKVAQPDDVMSAVLSIMHEMSAEMEVTRQAAHAVHEELKTFREPIVSVTKEASEDLDVRLKDMRKAFGTEKELRASATAAMEQILELHRDYETISLEDDVRGADVLVRHLRESYKSANEHMTRRENEIEKAIRIIEDKLDAVSLERKREKDPAGTLQMIYSSISLQGLRIKRLLTLLKSLAARVEVEDQNGRLLDLGLSLARLEKLSLVSGEKTRSNKKKLDKKVSESCEIGQEINIEKAEQPNGEEPEFISNDIKQVLRTLALRGGRECISAAASVEVPTSTYSKRREQVQSMQAITSENSNLTEKVSRSFNRPFNPETQVGQSQSSRAQPPPPPPVMQLPPTFRTTQRDESPAFRSKSKIRPTPDKLVRDTLLKTKRQARPPGSFDSQFQSKKSHRELSSAPRTSPLSKTWDVSGEKIEKLATVSKDSKSDNSEESSTDSASDKLGPNESTGTDDNALPTIDLTAPSRTKLPGWATVKTAIGRPPAGPSHAKPTPAPKQPKAAQDPFTEVPHSPDLTSKRPFEALGQGVNAGAQSSIPPATFPNPLTKSEEQSPLTPPPLVNNGVRPKWDKGTPMPNSKGSEKNERKQAKPAPSFKSLHSDDVIKNGQKSGDLFAIPSPENPKSGVSISTENEPVSTTPFTNIPIPAPFGTDMLFGSSPNRNDTLSDIKPPDANSNPTNAREDSSTIGTFESQLNLNGNSGPLFSGVGNDYQTSTRSSLGGATSSAFGVLTSNASSNAGASQAASSGASSSASFAFGSFSSAGLGGGTGVVFSETSFGNIRGENSSLFSAAASEMSNAQKNANVAGRPHSNDAISSDDSDVEPSRSQRQEGMETLFTPTGNASMFSGFEQSQASGFEINSGNAPLFSKESNTASAFTAGFGNNNSGFGNLESKSGGFGTASGGGFTSSFGSSSSFPSSGGFGESNTFISTSPFGVGSTFGTTSGFGAIGGGGFSGLSAKFGESSFGSKSGQPFGSPDPAANVATAAGFGVVGAPAQSPFGSVSSTGSGFGAPSSSGSGFASLAGSGGVPMFGNGQPPSFTSPAFSERRA